MHISTHERLVAIKLYVSYKEGFEAHVRPSDEGFERPK